MSEQYGIRPANHRRQSKWSCPRFTELVGAAVFAVMTFLLSAEQSTAESHPILDSATVDRLRSEYGGHEVLSVVVFKFIDKTTGSALDSVGVDFDERKGEHPLRAQSLRGTWRLPRPCSFGISLVGYRPMHVDGLRIPPDSLVLISVTMERGNDSITDSSARAEYINLVTEDLDDIVHRNILSGTVYDESLGVPVESVQVFCESSRRTTTTDSLGRFSLPLDTLRESSLHIWHPAYDSIKYEFSKHYARSEYHLDVYFERHRESAGTRSFRYNDTLTLFLLSVSRGSRSTDNIAERKCVLHTYEVKVGAPFGPLDQVPLTSCLPFRLIRTFSDATALVQCVESLYPIKIGASTNFAIVSDSTISFGTTFTDNSLMMTLQMLPDYSFPNVDQNSLHGPPLESADSAGLPLFVVDSCDVVRATVERTHLLNVIHLLNGDYDNLAQAFAPEFHAPSNHYEPTVENFRASLNPKRTRDYTSWKLEHFVFPYEFEVCVYGDCGQSIYDRYLLIMEEAGLKPMIGDVYVCFPHATVCPWGDRQAAVYRLYNGQWKIITWG